MKKIEGHLTGENRKFAIVVSRFNDLVTQKLCDGAIDCLKRHGVEENNIDVIWIPGAFEIPVALQAVAKRKKHHALIALGSVIRGSTDHYQYVCSEVAKGISNVSLQNSIPIMFGVLTTDNLEQAMERAGSKAGNKGWECALAALEMVNVLAKVEEL